MTGELKFGRSRGSAQDTRDLKFASYVTAPEIPTSWSKPNFGYGTYFKDWGMYGNDQVGDCVVASRAHLTRLFTAVGAPATAKFTTDSVISEYSAVTGYVPGDESTDNGTDMRTMCRYQKNTGLADADGNRHKIGAYVSVNGILEALQSVYVLGGVCIGFWVPESAMEQFDRGEIWDDVGDTNILGGHEVCGVGTMDWTQKITVVTWGKRQEMTKAFFEKYVDEQWSYVSSEILSAKGMWRGLNVDQLSADLNVLGQ